MRWPSESSPAAWRLFPFLAGIALAPFLFGSVNPPQQAIVGALFGVSLLLLIFELRQYPGHPVLATGWGIVLLCGLALPLLPLPPSAIAVLSPERLALARAFPLSANEPAKLVTLSLAPAATIQRVWELALVAVCFYLARLTARFGADRAFSMTLSVALVGLAASDIWYRLYGHGKLLGIWPDPAHHAAGTFANRNHFANWIFVAAFFVLGWMVQCTLEAPETEGDSTQKPTPRWGQMTFSAAAIALGIFMAFLSGSRGGLAAFACGLIFFALSMTIPRRGQRSRGGEIGKAGCGSSHSSETAAWRRFGLVFVLTLLGLGTIFIFSGGHVLDRFASGHSSAFKTSIWRNAWSIARKFPLCGTGPGTFETAFGIYKTFGGGDTFLFAENDFLQSLVENGFVVSALFFALVAISLARLWLFARNARRGTSALVFGGLAALVAFLAHCFVEFVFEVTATALLAAALFGYLHGLRDRENQPTLSPPAGYARVFAHLACALLLLALGGLHFQAWRDRRAGLKTDSLRDASSHFASSLRLWPGNPYRVEIFHKLVSQELARRSVLADAVSSATEPEIARMLWLDPMNWRLRMEAFALRAADNPADSRNEAWRIIRLNPLQPALPLYFTYQFAKGGAEANIPFMRAAAEFPENLNAVFDLAWRARKDAELLWKVTPNTDDALRALGYFAVGKGLMATALTAFERISAKVDLYQRGENLLYAGRPDLTLQMLTGNSARDNFLRSRALNQLGKYVEAMHAAEAVWAKSVWEWQPGISIARPASPEKAADLDAAEKIFRLQPESRDLPQLRRLADSSGLPGIRWMVFQTERDLSLFEAAAKTGLNLAGQVLQDQTVP